jgi:DNA helicase-2/ATP-dependent DNA helicase PcrA
MPKQNKLLIAAAGSGKTTHLANEASNSQGNILITTFTRANEEEIKKKIIDLNKCIPSHITVQTWFSFLLQHGIKPYQGTFNNLLYTKKITGLLFAQQQSGWYKISTGEKRYYAESQFEKFYFTENFRIYSDKLSKFVFESNKKSNGGVIDRLSRIYSHIFIDEVQDLAGYDLEIITLLFRSNLNTLLVGDPRQVTYLTHHARKHPSYKDGKIKQFILEKCKKYDCKIDEESLKYSHRNNAQICSFSSRLYPNESISQPCSCKKCREYESNHEGIFLVKEDQIQSYKEHYSPVVLRNQKSVSPEWNFGKSKGLGFDRVLIYPTLPIIQYLKNGALEKIVKGKKCPAFDIPNFYVALTRAKYSVGIVYNYKEAETFIDGVQKFKF